MDLWDSYGLLRHLSTKDRTIVEGELADLVRDIRESVDNAREGFRDLERMLDRILFEEVK